MPPSMITLIPNRRSANGNNSMKKNSDIWPNVWMNAGSGTLISLRKGFANV